MEEIREESAVLESTEDIGDWTNAAALVKSSLNLGYELEVVVISKVRVLLEFQKSDDQAKAVALKELSVEGKKVRLLRWSPGYDSLSGSWFQPSVSGLLSLEFLTIWPHMRL